ncbi:MAG: HEAT repeat domain-containing protein [Acidimicrobiia bacterium]
MSALLCALLTTLTVVRKVRRDRNEASILARRAEFRDLLLGGSAEALSAGLRWANRDLQARFDLIAALDAVWPQLDDPRREVARNAIVTSQIDRALTTQLRSRDPVRRASAAMLIGRLSVPDAAKLVAPLLADDDGDVRLTAAQVLGVIADEASAYDLIAALGAGHLEPERVIERLGHPWAVPAMLHVLEGGGAGDRPTDEAADPSISWRPIGASLARALGLAGDPRAEHALLALLRSGAVEERIAAARALEAAGTAAGIPALEAAVEDPAWQVRAQAARSLGGLGATASVPALAAHLNDSAWWVRAAVADSLVELGDPGLAVLREALVHADRYARDRAREALAVHHLETDAG